MIIGVVCPTTDEKVPTGDCLRCSLEHPERCGYDTIVLADLTSNRSHTNLSISEVTSDFLRKTVLYHLLNYYVAPSIAYYSTRGKWAHTSKRAVYLSPEFGETVREKRLPLLSVDPDISGQIDIYYTRYHRLVDYKTVSRIPDTPRPEHIRQINAYAELLRANAFQVDDAFITYLSYSKHLRMLVEVWERDRTQAMLREMISFYKKCLEDRVVPPRDLCAGEGRWWICKYCPFNEECQKHPEWWEIEEEENGVVR